MSLPDALSRTLLLMRDEFGSVVADHVLLDALTSTKVALIADAENLQSHSAQTAYATAAILMARSGHQVYLLAPDVPMIGPQLPLAPGNLISELMKVGHHLLPGIQFQPRKPEQPVDIAIAIDDPDDGSPIPTVAFVSFWAGLLAAAYMLRRAAGENIPLAEQQIYLTPTRAENPIVAHVPVRRGCPTCMLPVNRVHTL